MSDSRARIAEIRSENVAGDVSAKDISWLCDVVEEAALVRAVARRGYGLGWRRFDALLGASKPSPSSTTATVATEELTSASPQTDVSGGES
jgi:hypothetical protein